MIGETIRKLRQERGLTTVHLAHVESLGSKLWLRCNACGHSITPEPGLFAKEHHLDMTTPLLSIAKRLKCTHCNERKAHCWPEPYGIELKGPLRQARRSALCE